MPHAVCQNRVQNLLRFVLFMASENGVSAYTFAVANHFFNLLKSTNMTDVKENKLSMYRVAEKVLDDHSIVWNTTPAFVTTKTAFSGKIAAIAAASIQQQAVITGIATDKRVLKSTLIDVAAPVAAAVIAYASQTNNNELLEAVNYTHSDLVRTRDDQVAERCQIIHNHATAHLAALADYGITAPVLNALQTSITAYNTKVPMPGAAKQTKKTATINLNNLFKETDVILKLQLDKLMLVYKTSNSDFYNKYVGGREIINLGATHTRLSAQVKNEGGDFLPQATVALLQNNLVIYSGLTDDKGKVQLKKLKPGTYAVKTTKSGYTGKLQTGVLFKAGKSVTRTIVLSQGNAAPANGTATREGDIEPNGLANVDTSGIHTTATTEVGIEATGSVIRVYAAANINDLPGSTFIEVQPGTPVHKTIQQVAAEAGLDETHPVLMVQNTGAAEAHYKFVFTHLE